MCDVTCILFINVDEGVSIRSINVFQPSDPPKKSHGNMSRISRTILRTDSLKTNNRQTKATDHITSTTLLAEVNLLLTKTRVAA